MAYTLITGTGKIMQFYVQAVAELYCTVYGGVVISQQILDSVDFPAQSVV